MKQSGHIAIFSLAYAPLVGGAELATAHIAQRLADRFSFSCFTHRFNPAWAPQETMEGVSVVRVGRGKGGFAKLRYILLAWRAAERVHREKPFTAIWAIMAAYAGVAALLFKLRHPSIPFILTLQEGDTEKHILKRVGVFYPLWRKIFERADHVQAISAYLADFARRHGARCPVEVVANGVDVERFKATSDPEQLRHGAGKRQEGKTSVIITTSRLVRKNGVDILLRAFAELVASPTDDCSYRLVIAGDGPEEKDLKTLAGELGISGRVNFAGHVAPDDIPALLARADVFVRPSRSEGLGSSFLEAMAAGVPVIGTRVGGIPDFLTDRQTGLFAAADDFHDVAQKMRAVLSDDALRQRIIANARALVEQKYDWRMIAEQMGNIFSSARPLKDLLLATGIFPPDIGGSASYSALVAQQLPFRGYRVSVLAYGSGSGPGAHFVSRRLPKPLRHGVFFFKALTLSARADVVLCADASFGAGFFAVLAARLAWKRAFVRVTGDYAWEQGAQRFGVTDLMDDFQKSRYGLRVELLRMLQAWTVRLAHMVIAPSVYLKGIAVGWGVPEKKIRVVYNAVEVPEKVEDRVHARERLQLTGSIVVSAGRLVPWKGFTVLMEAFADLKKRIPDALLVIIGSGPQEAELKTYARAMPVANAIRFTGALPKNELHRYLSAADVFALNTAYEGFSHQILEAMAHGLPVVTTRVGGNLEIVRDGENGLLVSFDDASALEKALADVLQKEDLHRRLGTAARAATARFSGERMFSELAAVLGS